MLYDKRRKFNYISTSVVNNNHRIIKPTINSFIENREKENENKRPDIFDYNWLEEDN